ncbi:MAG: hypothetical protein ACQESR_22495 [Planctomycetota bacterium]
MNKPTERPIGIQPPALLYFRRSKSSGCKAARRKPSSRWSDSRRTQSSATGIFQAVECVRLERCPTQAVLPLVGLAADTVIRDRHISGGRSRPAAKLPDASRPPVGRSRGGHSHPRLVYLTRIELVSDNLEL